MDFLKRHKILTGIGLVLLLIVAFIGYRTIGPYRTYKVNLALPGSAVTPGILEVGVGMVDITPVLAEYDIWNDANNDGRFREKDGDTWTDSNNNGKRDFVWMAGFNSDRPAKGVNDPLWARAIAFRNNGVTVAMVTIDSIGIMHEKFIEVRKSIDPSLKIDHVMFSCLHNHESPDTMGIWSNIDGVGALVFKANYDFAYMKKVQAACKNAVEEAVRALQPADMFLAEKEIEPEGFVDDSRLPHVYDKKICSARFVKHGTEETIATLVSWGNHVETLGSNNSLLTSDFAHYLRQGVEKGVKDPNGVEGFGGDCLYFQGMVGGLMTQLHTTVPHRDGQQKFAEASFEKAEALGENVAIEVVKSQRAEGVTKSENTRVAVVAKTTYVPISGMYGMAMALGLIHPGYFWGKGRTEVNAFAIGDLEILTLPGELYPEIAEGGVEAPAGADFGIQPVEVPPLRKEMKGKVNMIFNLANDEIGYIIPKSQWDAKPPFAYGRDSDQYGEENSGGPDVAPALHKASMEALAQLHALAP